MSEKECQYDRIYEKTIDFDRPQFVKELQMQINDNKKKDKEIERLSNIIDKLEYWLKMEWHYNEDVNEQYAEAIENTLDRLKALKEGK